MNRLTAPLIVGTVFVAAGIGFLLDGLDIIALRRWIDVIVPLTLVLVGIGLIVARPGRSTEPTDRTDQDGVTGER